MKCPICRTELDQETYYDFVSEDTSYYNFCPECSWNDHPEYSYLNNGKEENTMMNIDILVTSIKTMTNLEVTVNDVQKGNVILTGISIGKGEIRPTVYTRDYEDLYDKYGYEVVAKQMLEDAINADNVNPIEIATYASWNYARENLKLCIAPKGTNNENVTFPYLDLELYVRVKVEKMSNLDGIASYKVTNNLLETWNVTREQLFHAALDCTKPTYKVQSMSEILFGIDDGFPMIVGRTEDEMHGASVLYCKDILKQISNKYDSDLVIIPSSIHEILITPMESESLDGVSELVREVNGTEVSPEEVLSDHAYIFHKDTSEITW